MPEAAEGCTNGIVRCVRVADGCALLVQPESTGQARLQLASVLQDASAIIGRILRKRLAAPGWAYAHSTVAQEVARISHNTATKQ